MTQCFPDDCASVADVALVRGFKYTMFEKMPSGRGGSQRQGILSELVTSMTDSLTPDEIARLRNPNLRDSLLNEKWEILHDHICSVTGAFHSMEIPDVPGQFHFHSDWEKFRNAISKMEAGQQKKLEAAFGYIWSHQRTWDFVRSGKWPQVFQDNYISPTKDGLDNLGDEYLSKIKLDSPSLEWALINAIFYVTVVEFASTSIFNWRLPSLMTGQSVDGPLLGMDHSLTMNEKNEGTKKIMLKFLGLATGRFIGAVTNLVSSAIFAWAITFWAHSTLVTWMVFTASAASTWVVMGIRSHRDESQDGQREAKETLAKLLWSLSSLHERLGRRDFHVGNVRHLLYRLEEQNISFGPTLYRLLDKRASRQSATGAST